MQKNGTRTILFILVFTCLASLGAQTESLRLIPTQVTKDIAVTLLEDDFEDITTVTLFNRSQNEMQLQWSKKVVSQPGNWETLVCNKTPNFSPFRTEDNDDLAENQRPFRIPAGGSLEFYLILRPNNQTGTGRVELSFSNITQPGRALETAVFDLKVSRKELAKQADSGQPKTLRIYPNPAVDNFFVEAPRNKRLGKVEVVNTLGRKIKTFSSPPGPEGYNIKDLPEGIYLINIYDSLGNKMKTLRLFHRRFGA